MLHPSRGAGKGLRSPLLVLELSFAASAPCSACHVLTGGLTLLGARPRRWLPAVWGALPKPGTCPSPPPPMALGTCRQGHLPGRSARHTLAAAARWGGLRAGGEGAGVRVGRPASASCEDGAGRAARRGHPRGAGSALCRRYRFGQPKKMGSIEKGRRRGRARPPRPRRGGSLGAG